ncbi:MAG: Ppx/GppA phosphatase family protein, partial [Alphaproteobacteria bacterium]
SAALTEEAMVRTIEALEVCAAKMRRRGVSRARAVATDACRRARNGGEFLARVAKETGIGLEVIAPKEEARLALAGCTPLFEPEVPRALLFDIGGGSTQLSWIGLDSYGRPRILGWTSLPCGVVRMAESYGGDRIPSSVYRAMVRHVEDLLEPFDRTYGLAEEVAAGRVQMLGTSGTVTTLAGVYLDLPRYDRRKVDGLSLSFAEVDAVTARLLAMDYVSRAALPSVGPQRADLLVAGCAVLEAMRRRWPVGTLRVADRGLREGMLLGMMAAEKAGRGEAHAWPRPARS